MRIWAGFWLVALIWGSSFMLISIGVEFVHPLHLVFIRTGIAAIGMGSDHCSVSPSDSP